jgi:hypothetical protein
VSEVALQIGDTLTFSYYCAHPLSANCYLFGEREFNEWRDNKSTHKTIKKYTGLSSGGGVFNATNRGTYYLVFENPSRFRCREVTFGIQIRRDITRQFCQYEIKLGDTSAFAQIEPTAN